MGIWEVVDAVKNRLPDPEPVKKAGRATYGAVAGLKAPVGGVLRSSYDHSRSALSTVAGLKAPVGGVLRSSYDHSRSALSTVDHAVRVHGGRVKESMPDKEVLAKIGWNLTDFAIDKHSRSYTGGIPVYKVVKEWLVNKDANAAADQNNNNNNNNVKAEELQEFRKRLERLEAMQGIRKDVNKPTAYPHSTVTRLHQKPEDVIKIFMMKGFARGCYLDFHDEGSCWLQFR